MLEMFLTLKILRELDIRLLA